MKYADVSAHFSADFQIDPWITEIHRILLKISRKFAACANNC